MKLEAASQRKQNITNCSGGGGGDDNYNDDDDYNDNYNDDDDDDDDDKGDTDEDDNNNFLVPFQKKCATTDDSVLGCESRVPHNMCPGRETLTKYKVRARRIDELSRFCFPLIFAAFNLCYWTYYLS
jgi:hypothetical protein